MDPRREGMKCYECQGYGHIARDCGNKKNKKKVLKATLDDSKDVPEIFTAFMARSCAPINSTESSSSNSKEESSDSDVEDSSEDEVDIKEAYEQLFQDCRRFHKHNEKLTVQSKVLKKERDSLKIALEELQAKFEALEASKVSQEGLIASLKSKLGQKDKELKEAQEKMQPLKAKQISASSKLDDILSSQRSPHDKRGLGFTDLKNVASTSGQKINVPPSKTTTVKNVKAPAPSSKKVKGKRPAQQFQKFQGTPFTPYRKFVPICHHCGIPGHIRPNCHKLYGLPLSYIDTRNSWRPNFQVSNRFSPLRSQNTSFSSRPYVNKPVRRNKKKNFSKPTVSKPNSSKIQNVFPKVRTVWVRKSDLYVTHTPKNVEGVSLDI